jgi:hypothetical protein
LFKLVICFVVLLLELLEKRFTSRDAGKKAGKIDQRITGSGSVTRYIPTCLFFDFALLNQEFGSRPEVLRLPGRGGHMGAGIGQCQSA